MPFSAHTSTALVLLGVMIPMGAAHGQSVGVGFDWLTDAGADFPGGPGLRVEASVPVGRFLGFRGALARSWGSDTRMGNLCMGLVYIPGCPEEPVEHRSVVTAGEAFVLARMRPLDGVGITLGFGVGHYSFDVSRYGEVSAVLLHPLDDQQEHRFVPAYLAELAIHPNSWGRLGVTLGASTAKVEFRGLVADAWGLYGNTELTRLSVAANYRLR